MWIGFMTAAETRQSTNFDIFKPLDQENLYVQFCPKFQTEAPRRSDENSQSYTKNRKRIQRLCRAVAQMNTCTGDKFEQTAFIPIPKPEFFKSLNQKARYILRDFIEAVTSFVDLTISKFRIDGQKYVTEFEAEGFSFEKNGSLYQPGYPKYTMTCPDTTRFEIQRNVKHNLYGSHMDRMKVIKDKVRLFDQKLERPSWYF